MLDNGTGYMKAGITGADAPSVHFPSCVGAPKRLFRGKDAKERDYHWPQLMRESPGDVLVGEKAATTAQLKLNFPLSDGDVSDWDAMEL